MTVTVADELASAAALFALTVTDVGADTLGAVSTPVLVILPADVNQTTEVLLVPLTVAANCWVAPEVTVALVGFTLTVILVVVAGFTVTVAEAFEVAEATLVAVIVA